MCRKGREWLRLSQGQLVRQLLCVPASKRKRRKKQIAKLIEDERSWQRRRLIRRQQQLCHEHGKKKLLGKVLIRDVYCDVYGVMQPAQRVTLTPLACWCNEICDCRSRRGHTQALMRWIASVYTMRPLAASRKSGYETKKHARPLAAICSDAPVCFCGEGERGTFVTFPSL